MIHRIVTVDKIKIGVMPERETIDAVFILKRMQDHHTIKKVVHVF